MLTFILQIELIELSKSLPIENTYIFYFSFEKEELKDEGAILIHHALYHLLLLYFNDFNRLQMHFTRKQSVTIICMCM